MSNIRVDVGLFTCTWHVFLYTYAQCFAYGVSKVSNSNRKKKGDASWCAIVLCVQERFPKIFIAFAELKASQFGS